MDIGVTPYFVNQFENGTSSKLNEYLALVCSSTKFREMNIINKDNKGDLLDENNHLILK